EPATRVTLPMAAPHRAAVSLRAGGDPAAILGHDVIGPLMHAFAAWIGEEAKLLAADHGRDVKPLFLLRDGYLPHRMFEALGGAGAAVEISRFSARRASFRDAAAVRDYLRTEPTQRIEILASQLLLDPGEAARLGGDHRAFREAVLQPGTLATILARSQAYADRLIRHVVEQGGIAAGDTVMLVDLGYEGTAQNLIAPLLTERLGVRVAGRYLLLRESGRTGHDKRGLFDARHYDNKTLHALSNPIAVIEQMCTAAQGSVMDYGARGLAVRKAPGIKGGQSALRDRVQAAALDYVASAAAGFHRPPAADDADARRRMAMAILARLLFLPQADEVAMLGAFDQDVNLGTDDLAKLIDADQARDGLRRRGIAYLNDVSRMYLSGELQPHGLPLNLALFGVSRLGIDLRSVDFQVSSLAVPVIMADGARHIVNDIPAYPTHDGFHVMTVPVGRFTLGVQIGAIADWVQIEDVSLHTVADYANARDRIVRPIPTSVIYDAMAAQGGGLYRCDARGLIFVPPPVTQGDEPLLLAVTFRPIVARQRVALRQAA
ncbi:MAG TPA: hydrolase, partial [Sphingomonas sp.]